MRTITMMLILGASCGAFAAEHASIVTKDEFKVSAHATITVDSDGGGIVLVTGPAGLVRVEADRKADSDDEARRLDVTSRLEGNAVHVRYKQTLMHHNSRGVDFRITAPADSKIDVRTGGGQIDSGGFSGGMHIDTGGGSIIIADARGDMKLRSGGGTIDVRHVAGTVDISTGGGSVKVDGALSGRNRVETGGGSIHVCIPGDSRLTVEAETGGGHANNDFGIPSDGHENQSFRGRLGDGNGGSLQLRTGGGSIHLTRS
jgi:hypothetical protein